jgi:hypothetical protein
VVLDDQGHGDGQCFGRCVYKADSEEDILEPRTCADHGVHGYEAVSLVCGVTQDIDVPWDSASRHARVPLAIGSRDGLETTWLWV